MKSRMLEKLLVAVADKGDIYTDAFECRAMVAGAENLSVLAGMLHGNGTSRVCGGTLFADGSKIGAVSVDIDGTVYWEPPSDFDSSDVSVWALELPNGESVPVRKIVTGDSSDDETLMISDAEMFYKALLAMKE